MRTRAALLAGLVAVAQVPAAEPPFELALVTNRDVVARVHISDTAVALTIAVCPALPCAPVLAALQASRGPGPSAVCGFDVVMLRDPRVFADGFELGSTAAWGAPSVTPPPPDGDTRVYLPWGGACASKAVTISGAGISQTVTLGATCRATTSALFAGPVDVELGAHTWSVVLPTPAARVRLGTLAEE